MDKVSNKLFEQPTSVLGEIEVNDRKTKNFIREGKSKIKIFPTSNNVIVKSTFLVPSAVITKREDIFKSSPTSVEVVAYGCETQEIEIGDKVLISYHASIERIDIPNNLRNVDFTQKRMIEALKGKSFAELSKFLVEMEEFYSVPYFSIVGIDNTKGSKNELSLLNAEIGNV